MTDERYRLVSESDTEPLTPEEIAAGWHFCLEFDGLLVGPDMPMELSVCTCDIPIDKPAYFPDNGSADRPSDIF